MSIFLIVSILLSFCLKRKHLRTMLLSLEVVVLGLYMMLYSYLMFHGYNYYFSMIFFNYKGFKWALGLSLLVSLVRTHGNNYLQMFLMSVIVSFVYDSSLIYWWILANSDLSFYFLFFFFAFSGGYILYLLWFCWRFGFIL